MMDLPEGHAPLAVRVDKITGLLAGLHPDAALAQVTKMWAVAPAGAGRRALLGARIVLMRRALEAGPVEPVAPEAVGSVPEPVFVPLPVTKPAAVNRGATMLLNLEDAAKMLLGAGDDDEAGADAPEAPDVIAQADADSVERALAVAEITQVIAAEAAGVAGKAKTRAPKAKQKIERGAAELPITGQVVLPDLAAQFGAMAEAEPPPQPKPKAGKGAAFAVDLSAQFAAMEGD